MIIAITLFIIAAILGLFFLKIRKSDDKDCNIDIKVLSRIIKLVIIVLLIICLVDVLFSCVTTVDAGHVGIINTFGDVSPTLLPSGLNLKNPFADIIQMSIQTIEVKETSSVPSKEGLIVSLDISILYKINPSEANIIYKSIGIDYADVVIVPQLRSIVRQVTAEFEAKALYTEGRENITILIYEKLQPFLSDRGIILERVLLRDLGLPYTVTTAIESKLKAEQEAQQMAFILQKETQEAQRKVIEAQGIANAQEIIHQSLTPAYLTWYWISHIKDSNAVYYVPLNSNGFPNPIMSIEIGK